MPTYTYKCHQCLMQFESFQSIVDPPLRSCPSCHGQLERVITGGSGIIFKGSGFYITDYSRKNSPAQNGSKETKKTDGTKKEIKPDK
jgi:putative FmdB family regulatory protein